jgi:hypothetical protein
MMITLFGSQTLAVCQIPLKTQLFQDRKHHGSSNVRLCPNIIARLHARFASRALKFFSQRHTNQTIHQPKLTDHRPDGNIEIATSLSCPVSVVCSQHNQQIFAVSRDQIEQFAPRAITVRTLAFNGQVAVVGLGFDELMRTVKVMIFMVTLRSTCSGSLA